MVWNTYVQNQIIAQEASKLGLTAAEQGLQQKIKVLAKLFDAGCKTEKDLKALTLPTILKIPDVTVPDMTVITELQEQVAKNRLFSYLGGGTDEPSDTTE